MTSADDVVSFPGRSVSIYYSSTWIYSSLRQLQDITLDHLVNAIDSQKLSSLYIILISLPPLIPLITTSYLLVFHLGLAFTVLLSNGSSLYYHLAPFELNVTKIFLHCAPVYVVFPRFCSRFSAFFLYTTPLSSLISSLNLNHHLYADDTQLHLVFICIYPAIRSIGRDTKFAVRYYFIMYGYRFLSRGFTDRREILHGGSATSQTGLLLFGG